MGITVFEYEDTQVGGFKSVRSGHDPSGCGAAFGALAPTIQDRPPSERAAATSAEPFLPPRI